MTCTFVSIEAFCAKGPWCFHSLRDVRKGAWRHSFIPIEWCRPTCQLYSKGVSELVIACFHSCCSGHVLQLAGCQLVPDASSCSTPCWQILTGFPKPTKSHKQSLSKIQEHRLIIGQIIQALPEKIIRNNLPRRCWQGETKGSCKLFHHDSVFPLGIFSGSSPTTFVVSTQEFAEPRPVAGTVFKLKVVSKEA